MALMRPSSSLGRLNGVLDELTLVEGDILSEERMRAIIRRGRPDICFHFAWHAEPGKYLESPENEILRQKSVALAEMLARAGCRKLVSAGTCFEYEFGPDYLAEESPLGPKSPYARAKAALQEDLSKLSSTSGMNVLWPRLFYQFGPFENERRLVAGIIKSIFDGRPARLTPGGQIRDYLHVEDVAGAIVAAAESDLVGPINIGAGRPVSVREVATTIGRLLGRPELIEIGALPYPRADPMRVCADNRKILARTHWKPIYSLDLGLKQTIEWTLRRKDHFR